METIWDGLKRRGLSEDALEKVMGLNLYNYYRLVVG
jgi:microsomal dipeptidase-like Zn-dependent dipeptidase